jgi:non-canonical purine NTP pyrophosphatase (RdgB/HAM1 family)
MDAPKNRSFSPLRLVLATGNLHKVQDIQEVFTQAGLAIEVLLPPPLEGLEENEATFAGNARLKADFVKTFARKAGAQFTLGDDSGFIVDALAGHQGLDDFPGVRSNRWLAGASNDTERCKGIYHLMREHSNRHARFVCALALLHLETEEWTEVEGQCALLIRQDETLRGSNGFGYDPMVHPVEAGTGEVLPVTMAELSLAEKNKRSHRAKALHLLIKTLEKYTP